MTAAAPALTLSVVIPTLNAAGHLPACLDRMRAADEIIVVDGGSSDETVRIAEAAGVRLVVAPKGRGVQLRAGADAALGDWLLFLHADTLPAPGWRESVAKHQARDPEKAGWFQLRIADRAWQARLIERAVAARSHWLGLPYGDQGLLVARSLYDRVGGYRPLPLMEDVAIVRRIGRSHLAMLDTEAWTSAERWRRDGWMSRSLRNLMCLIMFYLGVPAQRIARRYS